MERESEETELFVETETPEPAPAESTEAETEEPLVIETETGTSVNDREQEIQETPEKTEAEKPSEPPALSEGTATPAGYTAVLRGGKTGGTGSGREPDTKDR